MKLISSFFLLLFLAQLSVGQLVFRKKYQGFEANGRPQLASFNENGYVAVSEIVNNVAPNYQQMAVMRYDSCDQLVWSYQYDNPNSQLQLADVTTTSKNEILITGFSSNINYEAYLMKLDPNGQVVFTKSFQWPLSHFVYTIRELAGGDYFLFGNAYLNGGSETRNIVIRLDQAGNLIWAKAYFDIPVWGWAEATSDGGIITRSSNVIYKLDGQGNLSWAREIQQLSYYTSVPEEVSDGYVFARYPTSSAQDTATYLMKIDKNGVLLWTGEQVPVYDVKEVEELSDGSFVITGTTYIDTVANPADHTIIATFDNQGKVLKQQVLTTPSGEIHKSSDLTVTAEGSVLIAGRSEDPSTNALHMFLLKTDRTLSTGTCDEWSYVAKKDPPVINSVTRNVSPQSLTFSSTDQVVSKEVLNPQEEVSCQEEYPEDLSLGNDTTLCAGSSVELVPTGYNYHWYEWSTGQKTRNITIDTSGTYVLRAGIGCTEVTDTIKIKFFTKPAVEFTIHPYNADPIKPVRFTSLTGGLKNICWHVDGDVICDSTFEKRFDQNGKYHVLFTYEDSLGCSYSDTGEFHLEFYSIYMPNAFTPNADGVNDFFQPEGFGIVWYNLTVYNSWGDLVFEGENRGWDGHVNGANAPSDTYIYRIQYIRDDGKKYLHRGTVQRL